MKRFQIDEAQVGKMNTRLKLGRTIICAILMFFMINLSVEAADGTISFSDPSANVGEKVTVNVKVKTNGCNIGATDITLTYDASALEFVSGGSTATGGSGSVHIAGVAGDAETNNITYSLTFKALSAGSSKVNVSNYEIYDFDENLVSMSHVGNSTVSVSDGTPDASSDATLSSLTVSKGSLSPSFAPKIYQYTMSVGADVSSLAIDAKTNDSKATVSSITGADSLKSGENTVKIKVTAENGDTATYKITVTREQESEEEDTPEKTEEPKETEEPEETAEPEESEDPEATEATSGSIVVNDKELTPTDMPEDAEIPGFALSTLEYNGEEYPAFVSKYMEYYVLYMTDVEGNSDYYAYYKDIDTFTEFVQLTSGTTGNMFILDGYESDLTESGFEKKELEINGKKLTAWAYGDEVTAAQEAYKDYYLVAGVNQDGLLTWYQYDAQEGTYQRFVSPTTSEVTTSSGDAEQVSLLEAQLKELTKTYRDMKSKRLMIIIILGILDLILLLVIINLIFKIREKDEDDDEDDAWTEDYLEDDAFVEEEETYEEPENEPEEQSSLDEEERYQQDIEEEPPVQKEQAPRFRKNPISEKKSLVKETQSLFDDDDDEEFDFEIIDLDDDDTKN